jgi:hypothetical protein
MPMDMSPKAREDILSILRDAIHILKEKDSYSLRQLSDHSVHNASIFQDRYSISIAVVIYALSKIIDRMARIEPQVIEALRWAKDKLEQDDIAGYESEITAIIQLISDFDSKMQRYTHQVINEARIKKGSRIYEHGISLAQTATLLGTTQWELMKYIGQTTMADTFEGSKDMKSRLEFARGLFR